MVNKTPYDRLALVPALVASAVANEPYTGSEISDRLREQRMVDRIEARRRKLTVREQREFVDFCDDKCFQAYEHQAPFFMRCVRSKTNHGRDMLYMWCRHWLAGFTTTMGAPTRAGKEV